MISRIQTRTLVPNLLGLHLFRSRRTSCLLVFLLLWAAEAAAGSRISLLPFEGDRPRPLRWRVASVLKRSGHVVLGYAPPSDRGSAASLRAYAERRKVDLYVTGISEDTPQGWQLSLRFRNPDGKAVGQPVRFRAGSLLGLIRELKSEGPDKLDRAVRGGSFGSSRSAVAELPPGRALPLPKRRARPSRPRASDQPVLPGARPVDEPAAEAVAEAPAPKAVDLDARRAASGGPQTWDADAPDDDFKPAPKARSQAREDRAAKQRSALERLALGGAASSRPAGKREVNLDDDTRNALEESPASKPKAIDLDDEPEAESASEPAPATEPAAEEPETEEFVAAPPEEEEEESPPAKAKTRKRGTLFASRLPRKSRSSSDDSDAAAADESGETTVEDRDSDSTEEAAAARGTPNMQLGASAGFQHRSLAYSSDLYNRLRAPTTNGYVYRFEAAVFPFARPIKQHVAIFGRYEGALAGKVHDDRSDRNFGVTFSELAAGLRLRQPLGAHEIGVQGSVGKLSAGLDDSSEVSGVPEISYVLLSPSVYGTLRFGAVALHAALGYQRSIGDFGEMSSGEWFPHMEGSGFDGQLGLDYRFSPSVTLQASGSLRRFVLDMNSRPEDAVGGTAEVAGGAVDQYVSGYFGLQFTL